MTTTETIREQIDAFANRYDYDMGYQLEVLDAAPEAFERLQAVQRISTHRKALTREQHYVACTAMMQAERCSGCLELNLRMALEAGVDRGTLATLLERPSELPTLLRDIRDHAFDVSSGPEFDVARIERLRSALGDEGFAELAVTLAGCRIYTTTKRALARAPLHDVRIEEL